MQRAAGALALVALLCAGCGSSVTRPRVEQALATTFTNLYVQQQEQAGRTEVSVPGLGTTASCARRSGGEGPGGDWACRLQFTAYDTPTSWVYELEVHPDGCFRADGPPDAGPEAFVDEITGARTPNALFQFDGCFDPSLGARP